MRESDKILLRVRTTEGEQFWTVADSFEDGVRRATAYCEESPDVSGFVRSIEEARGFLVEEER